MFWHIVAWSIFALAAFPAWLFLWNLLFYKRAPTGGHVNPEVSILIPARDEELSIESSVRAALASRAVDLELIVLDDHSQDSTAAIVRRIALEDKRVRLVSGSPLPPNWCGKQFACASLAVLATKPNLCFIDADVQLAEQGLARMIAALRRDQISLMSGFPLQITCSPLEQLLLPLMHFLLLGYLPLMGMKKSLSPSFGAGCGQLFVVDREAYFRAGGHTAIRNSRHDGLTLPKAFRRAGLMTGLCDATDIASCRMYRNAREVLFGLLKNADEGLAAPLRIVPFSAVLFVGQCLPVVLLLISSWSEPASGITGIAAAALVFSYLPRLVAAQRFRQPLIAALFHPLAVLLLLAIQWYAFIRSLLRLPSTWKGRRYSTP